MINQPSVMYGGEGAFSVRTSFSGSSAPFPNNTDTATFDSTYGVMIDGVHTGAMPFQSYDGSTRRLHAHTFIPAGDAVNHTKNSDVGWSLGISANQFLDFGRTSVMPNADGWWCFYPQNATPLVAFNGSDFCMSDQKSTIATGQSWATRAFHVGTVEPTIAPGSGAISQDEIASVTGLASNGILYAKSTDHKYHFLNNNGTDFTIPGVASAGTGGHMTSFAANGIDIVDIGTPTLCPGGQAATGVLPNGNATGCFGPAGATAPLSTPANSSAACTAGQIWADTTYLYVCTATNTIKRTPLSTF